MRQARISTESGVKAIADLNDSETAKKVWSALPIISSAKRWGDEVYFDIPVQAPEEDPQTEAPAGTIAFWPPGSAFCIFFGQTPYSAVNIIGRLHGDASVFAPVRDGESITVERVTSDS
jgi:uncharacterized protein